MWLIFPLDVNRVNWYAKIWEGGHGPSGPPLRIRQTSMFRDLNQEPEEMAPSNFYLQRNVTRKNVAIYIVSCCPILSDLQELFRKKIKM